MGTGRSANVTRDQFTSDPLRVNLLLRNIKRNLLYQTSYLILCLHVNTTVYLDVIENLVEATLKRLRRKGRKLKEFVYECIRPSIPKSSWPRRYVKVRKVTKNDCKLNTKRLGLNKVTKHDKKYLLNCYGRVYQRIIKLKYGASRYLSLIDVLL